MTTSANTSSSATLSVPLLSTVNVDVQRAERDILKNVNLSVRAGEFVVVLGPNGAGKTTLLQTLAGLHKPRAGVVLLNDVPVLGLSPRERALEMAYLPQTRTLAWPNRVRDVVALGRFAHGVAPGRLREPDAQAVDRALAATGLTHFADRAADTLSGGELARMHCARVFASETPLLLADEPVASLDLRYQLQILDLFATYVRDGGAVLAVLHDVNLAARYAHRLIWLHDGAIVADGTPGTTLRKDMLERVYGVTGNVHSVVVERDRIPQFQIERPL